MSRERVNPISYLVRRLSKTLSLKRTSTSYTDAEELAEYIHHPHVPLHTIKRERTSRSTESTRSTYVPVRSSSACPAPLATAECFDITDTSDMEGGSKDQLLDGKQEAESENGSISPASYTDSEETQSDDKSCEDEDLVFTLSGVPTDQIYDFTYPEVERTESENGSVSTIRQTESSIDVSDSDLTFSVEEVEECLSETEEYVPEVHEGEQERQSMEEEAYREVYQESYEDYNYPQFEVRHDPQQDPFHEAALLAEHQKPSAQSYHLTTSPPAILVTSPSNHDITQKSPSRPPPPVSKPVPPPLPPPPKEAPEHQHAAEPARPPPPRPLAESPRSATPEASPSTPRKKKHKIFGINVGPLPSDPDPNFPFESHFEKKHIVPNPKKALRNIIGGEKRKQRLKRKVEAELERIIKTEPKTKSETEQEGQKDSSVKGYLSDWREFQARIEAKVTDSTSRLESAKWSAEPVEEKAKSSSSWANFEAHQEPQVVENWAEFAEETKKEPQSIGESIHQEFIAENLVRHFETQAETAIGEDDNWADFDNLRIGDQLPEEGRSNLSQVSINDWVTGEKPVETEVSDNWANFGALEFPESNHSDSGASSENRWADVSFNQAEHCVNFPEEQPATLKEQAADLDWFESGAEDHRLQSYDTGQHTLQVKEEKPFEKTDSSEQNLSSEEEGTFHKEHPGTLCIIETESATQMSEEKPKDSISSQSSSFDQQSSTPSQFQNYGYDDPSSQLATEIYQSSAEEPTIMDLSSAASSITDREQSNDYHYDNLTSSNKDLQEHLHPTEYGDSYGYDDCDAEKHSIQENSSVTSSDVNEIVSDIISTAESEMAQEISSEIVDLYINSGRSRPRNFRQGTLTENNPFRRISRTENPDNIDQRPGEEELALEDEKTTFATVTLFSQSVRDEDEEMEESAPGYEAEEMSKTPLGQNFDPFQTIYPTSDKDSSSDVDEDPGRAMPAIAIKRKEIKDITSGVAGVNVPILPAPPKTQTPAYVDDLTAGDDDEFGSRIAKKPESLSGLAIDSSVPVGWETFTSDTNATSNTKATDDELVKAFEVDWSKPPAPVAAVPEAPRPETPDPNLEIPFNAPPPENSVWRLWVRYPEKKKKVKQISKYTTDRTWKEIAITLSDDRGRCEVNLHEIDPDTKDYNKQPYRTLRMEPYMQLSRCKLQQYDKYGKLNIFKINHVAYRELPGMRPEKFSIKTFQNLISHKPKQNVALDHLPVYTEILKFGSMDRPLMRSLMTVLEDSLMKIPAHKDEGLNYTHEEVCCYVIDEYVGELSVAGIIEEQKARTRIFCSAFVNGGPHIVLGINDKWRFGREVVRRSDILPVLHDDWITIWKPEFHSCLEMDGYENDHLLKFYPLDGCKFELMRFRVSLRHNRELPMQVHCSYSIDDRKISMRCELMVPGYFTATGRSGATPCEDVEIRIPVPEEWIYHFRVEKHHKMGSVHSALRKPGRIKGLERITQMAQSLLPPSLLEASIGLAKYEHIFKAIVWRIPRVPDKNEASYRPHLLTCNLLLNPHDTVPEWSTLEKDIHIEFTMPSSTVSGTAVRSISVETTGNAEKFVKYTAKYRLTKTIDYQLGHRKDKPLIGILDAEAEEQNSSSDSSEPEEDDEDVPDGSEASRVMEQTVPVGVAVDDLLGEGLNDATLTHSSKSAAQPDTSQSKELADIFG